MGRAVGWPVGKTGSRRRTEWDRSFEPRTVSLIAIAANDIPVDFSQAEALALAEDATALRRSANASTCATVPFVTIDGEDARDFDDAVFRPTPTTAADNPGGWRLMVAIADVAWYVRAGDALDRSALSNAATPSTFPDRVVPMLPEALSATAGARCVRARTAR